MKRRPFRGRFDSVSIDADEQGNITPFGVKSKGRRRDFRACAHVFACARMKLRTRNGGGGASLPDFPIENVDFPFAMSARRGILNGKDSRTPSRVRPA